MSDIPQDTAAGVAAEGGLRLRAEVEDVGPCKKKLVIEIPAEAVAERLKASIGELQRNAILPGFRRGHAPLSLIEKRFGSDIQREVKSNLVVDAYRQALVEKELMPISDPELDVEAIEMKEGSALSFEVAVEVWPEFDPEGYEGLKLEKPSSEPTDEETEAEIKNLQMRTTTFEEVTEGGAEATDFIMASYAITSGGKEVASAREAGVRPEDSVVGRMKIDGLKDDLVGKSAGDKIEKTFTVDDEYFEEELRGKEASLSLEVTGLRRPKVPEVTDEWAKELGFESLEELKTVVARNVGGAKEAQAEQALKNQIHEKLVETMQFELPEDAVRRQKEDIVRRERMGLQYRGATSEDIDKISEKLDEASSEAAARDLKLFFILSKIAQKENISATPEDIEMKIAELAARYRTTAAKMRERLKSEEMLPQIALQIREEKTISHILSKSEITEAAAPKKKKPEAKEAKPKKPRVSSKAKPKAAAKAKAEGKKDKPKAKPKKDSKGAQE